MRFHLNEALMIEAGAILGRRPRLYWLLGGSCSGKSTVARLIGETIGMEVVDMDALIFGRFMSRYTAKRHPVARSWFGATNPLDWALSLSWEQFDSLNRASNAEFFDLLADELAERPASETMLIEGGFTHPSLVTRVAAAGHIVCLTAGDEIRWRTWETAEERLAMKRAVLALDQGEVKWRKFLAFDKSIAEIIEAESEAAGIPIVRRTEVSPVEVIADRVMAALGLNGRV